MLQGFSQPMGGATVPSGFAGDQPVPQVLSCIHWVTARDIYDQSGVLCV